MFLCGGETSGLEGGLHVISWRWSGQCDYDFVFSLVFTLRKGLKDTCTLSVL